MSVKRAGFLITAILSIVNVWAGVIKGDAFYHIDNLNRGGRMSVNNAGSAAVGAAMNDNDLKQLWYVTEKADGSGYYFRNVATGGYLCSSKQASTIWPVKNTTIIDDSNMLMAVTDGSATNPGTYTIRSVTQTSGAIFAHMDGSSQVVCWNAVSSSPPSFWYFNEVVKSDEEKSRLLERFNITDEIAKNDMYQSHLEAMFADKSCTRLRTDVGDIETNEHFLALPDGLKTMIRKISSSNWTETLQGQWDGGADDASHWNDRYSRKYRVQYYEPYSEGSTAASMAGIQSYTNMNNPTGILGDADQLMYVMVEDPIPAGATLYIGGCPDDQMYNSVTAGIQLKQGLNTILCTSDHTHYFIYYTVSTVSQQDQNGRKRYLPVAGRELSNYKPIKIHIEGGRLNGFFNYIGDDAATAAADPDFHYAADVDADYRYTSVRATHVMYDLIGKYVILHLHLKDTPSQPGEKDQMCVLTSLDPALNPGDTNHYDPAEILASWDNMCFAERILMGIQSDADIADPVNNDMYSSIVGDRSPLEGYVTDPGFHYCDYFNNRMMGISQQGTLFMNATSWRTAYNVSTIAAILTQFPEAQIWGPAHEYGHMNQPPMNIAGTTEVSNNIFSNVALYYAPKGTTSRCDYPSSQLKHFLNGDTYLLNETWGTTRMYWQLWIYYHATRHNPKFYPRLYELLRRYPISKTTVAGGIHNPKNDMLHFAKMCCIAAGEDLTNFFAAWGFFFPYKMMIDDYSQYDAVLTQEDIDLVKEEIKSYGFPVNNAIITIDDRVDSPRPSHATFKKDQCGDVGGLQSYIDGATPSGNYGYMVEDNKVTISKGDDATDGVGFLIFDSEGNLVAFSNSYEFEVTPEIAEQLFDGTLTIQAIGSDGESHVDVVNTYRDGSNNEKITLIKDIAQSFDGITAMIDETGTKVGYYYSSECAEILSLSKRVADMMTALESNPDAYTGEDLTDAYLDMKNAYDEFKNNTRAKIPVKANHTYVMVNNYYPTKLLTYSTNASQTVCASGTYAAGTVPLYSQQWMLEAVPGETNRYYVRNVDNGLYVGYTATNSTTFPMTVAPEQKYALVEKTQGKFAIAADGKTGICLHHASGGNIVRWSDTDPSIWTITCIKDDEFMDAREELAALIKEAQERLEEAGDIFPTDSYPVDYTHISDMSANTAESTIFTNLLPTVKDSDSYIFTTWKNLFDDDPGTYFFSRHDGTGTTDGYYVYIRFRAPGVSETFRHVTFSYVTTTRTNLNASTIDKNPKEFDIDASTNGTDWKTVYRRTDAPTGQGITVTTPEFDVPVGTKYIRFVCKKNQGGYYYTRNNIVQHSLVLGDVSIQNRTDEMIYMPDNKKYPAVKAEHMMNVYKALASSRDGYADSASSLSDILKNASLYNDNGSYNEPSLAYHHLVLGLRMKGVTGIDEVSADESAEGQPVYYNMLGVRVDNPSHGVYIRVCGSKSEKVVIK